MLNNPTTAPLPALCNEERPSLSLRGHALCQKRNNVSEVVMIMVFFISGYTSLAPVQATNTKPASFSPPGTPLQSSKATNTHRRERIYYSFVLGDKHVICRLELFRQRRVMQDEVKPRNDFPCSLVGVASTTEGFS